MQHEDGSFSYVDPQPVRTYRGHVHGAEGSVVAAALAEDGLHARVIMPDGTEKSSDEICEEAACEEEAEKPESEEGVTT